MARAEEATIAEEPAVAEEPGRRRRTAPSRPPMRAPGEASEEPAAG